MTRHEAEVLKTKLELMDYTNEIIVLEPNEIDMARTAVEQGKIVLVRFENE